MSKLLDALAKIKKKGNTSKSQKQQTKDKNQVKPKRATASYGTGRIKQIPRTSGRTWATIQTDPLTILRSNNVASVTRTTSGSLWRFRFTFDLSIDKDYALIVSNSLTGATENEASHTSTYCEIEVGSGSVNDTISIFATEEG